jgi:hypothetical protein
LACGPRTWERASLGLGGGGGVQAEDGLSSGMTSGPHGSAAQVRRGGGCGVRRAGWAASGLLRGWRGSWACWLLGLLLGS